MKKCQRCKIVFHRAERTRCLYCDGLLLTVGKDDTVTTELPVQDTALIEMLVKDKESMSQENVRHIISSYFKSRTFQFLYKFSHNEMKMGDTYKRFLVQPLNGSSFFMIPWVVVSIFDSLFFRLVYRSYCPTCKWKFAGSGVRHDPKECSYNREYVLVINAVLSGHIARLEETFEFQAMGKLKRGERSAYFDLCARKNPYEGFIDTVCVWFSIGVIIYIIVALAFPWVLKLVHLIHATEQKELSQ